MTNVARHYAALPIMLLTLSGCKSFPEIEHCITGGTPGWLLCADKRMPKEHQEYSRPANNDYCTNPDDLNTALDWVRKHDK